MIKKLISIKSLLDITQGSTRLGEIITTTTTKSIIKMINDNNK